jgi:hypothetical protein
MMLFGLVLGRWWRFALVAGTCAWPALLWTQGLIGTPLEVAGAAALALANTAVGVLVHQLVLSVVRRGRARTEPPVEAGR